MSVGRQTHEFVKLCDDISFTCVCPVIDNEVFHNIVKVVCGSTRLSRQGSTATLTMLCRNFLGSFLVLQGIIGIFCRLACSSFKLFHQLIASQIIYCFLGTVFQPSRMAFFSVTCIQHARKLLKASILFSSVPYLYHQETAIFSLLVYL